MKIGLAGPLLAADFNDLLEQPYSAPSDCSQVFTSVNLLARGMLDRGHEVVLFTLDASASDEIILTGPSLRICIGPYRGAPHYRARYRAMDFFRKERRFLQQAIDREAPDVVHANWSYEYALGALASGVPTLISVRDWAPAVLAHYRNAYRLIRYLMNWVVLHRGKYLVANSPYIREKLRHKTKRDVPLIPNPIEDSFLCGAPREFPAAMPSIICVGRNFTELKNQSTLIRALPHIRERIPDCELHLVGPDLEPGGKAEQWAKANGLNEGIVYVGPSTRDEIKAALDAAVVMVHPSLEESFGGVLVEAMARRVPVVGGRDSGAVPWVLGSGKAGVLCDVRNPQSIASAAVGLLSSPDEWERISLAGYERVRTAFRLSKVAERFEEEYRRVLTARQE